MCKNNLETYLGAFNEELCAIKFFLKCRNFGNLRVVSSWQKRSENLLPGKASHPHRNVLTFQKKCNQKNDLALKT